MFTTRKGIPHPLVERGICDIDINAAQADVPAHGLPVPAIFISMFSSSWRKSGFVASSVFDGVPVAQIDTYRFSFLEFQVQ